MSKFVDNKSSKQARIDAELLRRVKMKAASLSMTIKEYLEGLVIEDLADETAGKEINS